MAAKKTVARKDRARLSLEEVRADIKKKYGDDVLVKGSELKSRTFRRLTSGSLALDIMLGGGWPVNTWNEIIGNASSGKTSTIFKTIAANQALDPKWTVLWVASEPFVHQWAEAAGCDLDRFEFVETNVMEEAYEAVLKYVDNRLVDCVVIDSFPALSPADEDANGMDEWQVGLGARLTGKFLRKSGSATRRSLTDDDRDCLLLVVNQWRDKIGVLYGDPRTTPGGKAKDYWYFTRVEMKRDEWIEHNKKRVGIVIKAHTLKNKTAPAERVAAVDFYFDSIPGHPAGDFDYAKDLLVCGLYTDIIEKGSGGSKGSKFTYLGDVWYGEEAMLQALREDLGLQQQLRTDVLRSQGVVLDEPEPAPKARRKPAAPKPAPVAKPVRKLVRKS